MSVVESYNFDTKIRVLEWPTEKFSCNDVSESQGLLMVRAYTRVEEEAIDEFKVNSVQIAIFNLEHYLLSQDSLVSQSLFYNTIKSTLAFLGDYLGDINASALSQPIYSYIFSNFQFNSSILNSRKSKIIIVIDIFLVENLMDDNIGSNIVEIPSNNLFDIVSMLRFFLDIELPINTDESTVLEEIEAPVKTKKLIDDEDKCPICLQEFLTGTVVATTPCSHVFHSDCLLRWLLKTNSCPMCRSLCATVVHI